MRTLPHACHHAHSPTRARPWPPTTGQSSKRLHEVAKCRGWELLLFCPPVLEGMMALLPTHPTPTLTPAPPHAAATSTGAASSRQGTGRTALPAQGRRRSAACKPQQPAAPAGRAAIHQLTHPHPHSHPHPSARLLAPPGPDQPLPRGVLHGPQRPARAAPVQVEGRGWGGAGHGLGANTGPTCFIAPALHPSQPPPAPLWAAATSGTTRWRPTLARTAGTTPPPPPSPSTLKSASSAGAASPPAAWCRCGGGVRGSCPAGRQWRPPCKRVIERLAACAHASLRTRLPPTGDGRDGDAGAGAGAAPRGADRGHGGV